MHESRMQQNLPSASITLILASQLTPLHLSTLQMDWCSSEQQWHNPVRHELAVLLPVCSILGGAPGIVAEGPVSQEQHLQRSLHLKMQATALWPACSSSE